MAEMRLCDFNRAQTLYDGILEDGKILTATEPHLISILVLFEIKQNFSDTFPLYKMKIDAFLTNH